MTVDVDDGEVAWAVQQHDNWMMADEIQDGMKARRGLKDRAVLRASERPESELQQKLVRRFADQHGWQPSRSSRA
jgi:hypothetical protein